MDITLSLTDEDIAALDSEINKKPLIGSPPTVAEYALALFQNQVNQRTLRYRDRQGAIRNEKIAQLPPEDLQQIDAILTKERALNDSLTQR